MTCFREETPCLGRCSSSAGTRYRANFSILRVHCHASRHCLLQCVQGWHRTAPDQNECADMRARQTEPACPVRHLQEAHDEEVHSALERPLLCSLPLPAVVRARQLRRDAALWLMPHSAHILAESGVRDGCSVHTPSQHDSHEACICTQAGRLASDMCKPQGQKYCHWSTATWPEFSSSRQPVRHEQMP